MFITIYCKQIFNEFYGKYVAWLDNRKYSKNSYIVDQFFPGYRIPHVGPFRMDIFLEVEEPLNRIPTKTYEFQTPTRLTSHGTAGKTTSVRTAGSTDQ